MSYESDDTTPDPITDADDVREKLVRIINLNTGHQQADRIKREYIFVTACANSTVDPAVARGVLNELVEDGIVNEEDGRYWLPNSDSTSTAGV